MQPRTCYSPAALSNIAKQWEMLVHNVEKLSAKQQSHVEQKQVPCVQPPVPFVSTLFERVASVGFLVSMFKEDVVVMNALRQRKLVGENKRGELHTNVSYMETHDVKQDVIDCFMLAYQTVPSTQATTFLSNYLNVMRTSLELVPVAQLSNIAGGGRLDDMIAGVKNLIGLAPTASLSPARIVAAVAEQWKKVTSLIPFPSSNMREELESTQKALEEYKQEVDRVRATRDEYKEEVERVRATRDEYKQRLQSVELIEKDLVAQNRALQEALRRAESRGESEKVEQEQVLDDSSVEAVLRTRIAELEDKLEEKDPTYVRSCKEYGTADVILGHLRKAEDELRLYVPFTNVIVDAANAPKSVPKEEITRTLQSKLELIRLAGRALQSALENTEVYRTKLYHADFDNLPIEEIIVALVLNDKKKGATLDMFSALVDKKTQALDKKIKKLSKCYNETPEGIEALEQERVRLQQEQTKEQPMNEVALKIMFSFLGPVYNIPGFMDPLPGIVDPDNNVCLSIATRALEGKTGDEEIQVSTRLAELLGFTSGNQLLEKIRTRVAHYNTFSDKVKKDQLTKAGNFFKRQPLFVTLLTRYVISQRTAALPSTPDYDRERQALIAVQEKLEKIMFFQRDNVFDFELKLSVDYVDNVAARAMWLLFSVPFVYNMKASQTAAVTKYITAFRDKRNSARNALWMDAKMPLCGSGDLDSVPIQRQFVLYINRLAVDEGFDIGETNESAEERSRREKAYAEQREAASTPPKQAKPPSTPPKQAKAPSPPISPFSPGALLNVKLKPRSPESQRAPDSPPAPQPPPQQANLLALIKARRPVIEGGDQRVLRQVLQRAKYASLQNRYRRTLDDHRLL